MNAPFRWMKTKWIGFCRILFANVRIFSFFFILTQFFGIIH